MAERLILETTTIEAGQTAGEITALLTQIGARRISMTYDDAGNMVGMSFFIQGPDQRTSFDYQLPIRAAAVFEYLRKRDATSRKRYRDRKKTESDMYACAVRVAWRQLLLWVKAQVAFVQTQQADTMQVFLPYCTAPDGRTMYDLFVDQQVKQIAAPKEASRG